MTDARLTRLYVFAVTLLVFFVVWAVVAARPWVMKTSSTDRQVAALAAREQRIHFESLLVHKLSAQRARQPDQDRQRCGKGLEDVPSPLSRGRDDGA